jgi:molybdopterin converting factor small subunit
MSTATIRIPTPLRTFTKGREEVRVRGGTVALALADLGEQCPGVLERVLGKDGDLRPFVNIFVGSSDVRSLRGLATPVEEGAVLSIIPAVAGGVPAVAGGVPACAGGLTVDARG